MAHQQADEKPVYTRQNPAQEQERLCEELSQAGIPTGPYPRVLAMMEARVNGTPAPIPFDMLEDQRFPGVEIVGIVATLSGREGLFAQCGWFDNDDLDWIWAKIVDIRSIYLRADFRFRGGAPCVWVATSFAEYAVITPNAKYDDSWELTLTHLGAPRCDTWPMRGFRPDWWPDRWAEAWPYARPIEEQYPALLEVGELADQTDSLSIQPSTSSRPWRRLGPKGDARLPGQPMHHLSQMSEWVIDRDAGLRKVRNAAGSEEDAMDARAGNGAGKRARQERAPRRKPKPRRDGPMRG
ncbi:hypothetical protein FRC08_014407 [Ceratobasidium sp. 394]|nr:hypothetical protein FRC08_014407 [Ceratobasidium sp. 394]KAG9102126.1 hypothetical protein FS749_015709 [Ceratobasidium sp. UAMH 11750]